MPHGPDEIFLYLDGYDLLVSDVQNLEAGVEQMTAETSGLGKTARTHAPINLAQGAVSFEGTIFNDGSLRSRAALNQLSTGPSATDRIFTLGMAGTSIGSEAEGYEGAIQGTYKIVASHEDLQRIAATFQISGQRDDGLVIFPLDTVTSDANSQSTSLDNGSSSTGGLVGYLHVNSFDGDTGDQFLVTIQESSNDSTYADILAFTCTSSTGEPFVDRASVASSGVEQYLALTWEFTDSGLGDADFFAMAART